MSLVAEKFVKAGFVIVLLCEEKLFDNCQWKFFIDWFKETRVLEKNN